MSQFTDSAQSKQIDQVEHNNDASAKRVVQYYQDGNGDYIQAGIPLVPNVDYDYIDIQQTSSTVETYVFKTGGSGGTTVQTIVVTYTSSAKTDLDKVEYS